MGRIKGSLITGVMRGEGSAEKAYVRITTQPDTRVQFAHMRTLHHAAFNNRH